VGWRAGVVAARLRAETEVEAEVGSVIVNGRVRMVETAYRSQWIGSKDAKQLCTTYHYSGKVSSNR
jgi:hypothetical protein